jgi:hypothetical protein
LSRAALASAGALALALAACAPQETPLAWQRPDVSEATTRAVERDCRQRAIQAIARANGPADTDPVHRERNAYVERCMYGSGFSLKR